MSISIDRRTALLAAVGATGAMMAPRVGFAADKPKAMLPMAKARGFKIGSMDVVALLAGSVPRDNPHGIFGLNVSDEEFSNVSDANFISTDMAQFYFTPSLVRVGDNVILFDTGLNAGGIRAALSEAGVTPDQVNACCAHPHAWRSYGGLMDEGKPTFANAVYLTGQKEYDHWAKSGNKGFDSNVKPLAEKNDILVRWETVLHRVSQR